MKTGLTIFSEVKKKTLGQGYISPLYWTDKESEAYEKLKYYTDNFDQYHFWLIYNGSHIVKSYDPIVIEQYNMVRTQLEKLYSKL